MSEEEDGVCETETPLIAVILKAESPVPLKDTFAKVEPEPVMLKVSVLALTDALVRVPQDRSPVTVKAGNVLQFADPLMPKILLPEQISFAPGRLETAENTPSPGKSSLTSQVPFTV